VETNEERISSFAIEPTQKKYKPRGLVVHQDCQASTTPRDTNLGGSTKKAKFHLISFKVLRGGQGKHPKISAGEGSKACGRRIFTPKKNPGSQVRRGFNLKGGD